MKHGNISTVIIRLNVYECRFCHGQKLHEKTRFDFNTLPNTMLPSQGKIKLTRNNTNLYQNNQNINLLTEFPQVCYYQQSTRARLILFVSCSYFHIFINILYKLHFDGHNNIISTAFTLLAIFHVQ